VFGNDKIDQQSKINEFSSDQAISGIALFSVQIVEITHHHYSHVISEDTNKFL
jgi:hypothetical protein